MKFLITTGLMALLLLPLAQAWDTTTTSVGVPIPTEAALFKHTARIEFLDQIESDVGTRSGKRWWSEVTIPAGPDGNGCPVRWDGEVLTLGSADGNFNHTIDVHIQAPTGFLQPKCVISGKIKADAKDTDKFTVHPDTNYLAGCKDGKTYHSGLGLTMTCWSPKPECKAR